MDTVFSFSIPSTETSTLSKVKAIKKHCKTNGLNFSFLVMNKLEELYSELGLQNGTQGQ